ncbi:hypothetical protein [Streptomyces sp. NRRL F-2799]|uniref:hypothetical protein n=1 Tax=Streptomyces sp. NRRL F-2799 TaxID=1463844 RepID=UPI0004C6EA9E|nr:hypothetical protein [Streptomyces sp. NRRL F-2799]
MYKRQWLLVVVALVVALGAGGTLYTLLRGGGVSDTATVVPETVGGDVPVVYLGRWEARVDGAGTHRLTLTQGRVGERVLILVADGADHHCVYTASLARKPDAEGPLRLTATTVTSGAPLSSCAPGTPTILALSPDGRLKRTGSAEAEAVTYSRVSPAGSRTERRRTPSAPPNR